MNKIQFKSRKEVSSFLKEKGIDTTDWSELKWLSINIGQADIHMMFLAEAIYDAMNESTPKELKEGEWHIPYGDNFNMIKLGEASAKYMLANPGKLTNEQLMDIDMWKAKISIARCARLSYQTLGDNPVIDYTKDIELYDILSTSGHWSPFEHIAKVMTKQEYNTYIKGKVFVEYDSDNKIEDISYDEESFGWSRNFRGFIQYRELLD